MSPDPNLWSPLTYCGDSHQPRAGLFVGAAAPTSPAQVFIIGAAAPASPAQVFIIGAAAPASPAQVFIIGAAAPASPAPSATQVCSRWLGLGSTGEE